MRTLGLVTCPFYLQHEILGGFVLYAALSRALALAMAAVGAAACFHEA